MHSPIKTIIKNKSNKCFFCSTYPRYQVALRPAGEKGDTVELCGDIFTMMKTRQEIEGLMKSYLNGVIDITFGVDKLFNTLELTTNSCVKYPNVQFNEVVDTEAETVNKPAEPEQKPAETPPPADDTEGGNTASESPANGSEDTKKAADPADTDKTEQQPVNDTAKPVTNRRRSKNIKIG